MGLEFRDRSGVIVVRHALKESIQLLPVVEPINLAWNGLLKIHGVDVAQELLLDCALTRKAANLVDKDVNVIEKPSQVLVNLSFPTWRAIRITVGTPFRPPGLFCKASSGFGNTSDRDTCGGPW